MSCVGIFRLKVDEGVENGRRERGREANSEVRNLETMDQTTTIALGTLMMLACEVSGPSLGSRITYEIYEVPHPLIGGEAGSCMPKVLMAYPNAHVLKWAPGTSLEVHAWWPDRTDCAGWWRPVCPATNAEITPINPEVWNARLPLSGGPAAEAVITMGAAAVGTGGFKITVNGAAFSPDFVLTVDKPAAIRFEWANGHYYDDVIPGPISELTIAAGQGAAIAVTLHNVAGEHLCGPVPAKVAITGSVFSLDRYMDEDFVNLPYHIIAGSTPGVGSLEFTVGDITASMMVHVTAGP